MVERKLAGVLQSRQAKLAIHNSNIILNSPISRKRKNDENHEPAKPITRESIYEDPPTPASKRSKLSSKTDCAVQTEDLPCLASNTLALAFAKDLPNTRIPEEKKAPSVTNAELEKPSSSAHDVLDMLTSDKPGERYWEMVASERKKALLASLAENKQLHKCNSELQQQVHSMGNRLELLQKDNVMLEEMLAEAKKLAELVEAATEEDSQLVEDAEVELSQRSTSPSQESRLNYDTRELNSSVS